MSDHVAKALLQNMHELLDQHSTLLELAEKKKGILVQGKLQDLEEIMRSEQSLIAEISKLEAARMENIRQITGGQGASEQVEVENLLPFLSEQDRKDLQELKSKLLRVLKKLQEVNESNNELIRLSLSYIDFMLNVIAGSGEEAQTYGPGKKNDEGGTSRHLIDWEA